jgi:hypothetical protein
VIVPGAPITITANLAGQVPYPPSGPSQQWAQVLLVNSSPYLLNIAVGGTPLHLLPAYTANVYPLTVGPTSIVVPGQPLTFTASGPPTGAATSGTLTPSFGQYGDTFPGTYPLTLTAQAIAAAGATNLLTPPGGLTLTSASVPVTYPLNPTTRSLVFVTASLPGAAVSCTPTILGGTSGNNWANNLARGQSLNGLYPLGVPLTIPCYGIVDPTISLILRTGVAGQPVLCWLAETPDEVILGTPTTPIAAMQVDPQQYTPHTLALVACPAGVNTVLLAAPAANSLWEIVNLGYQGTVAAAVVVRIQGTSSGGWLLTGPVNAAATAITSLPWFGTVRIGEGIQMQNGGNTNAMNAFLAYRAVPLGIAV